MSGSPLLLLVFSFFALSVTGHVSAQPGTPESTDTDSLSWYIQKKYGLDQELFNGVQYYKRYRQFLGDPYFPEDHFYRGSVTLRGKKYEDVQLKYDSYSQYLILEYHDLNGIYNQLIINNAHVDAFQLGGYYFQKISLSEEEPLFYQIVNSGPVTCYIHWKKDISSISYNFQYTHEFSGLVGEFHIRFGGQIHSFSSRKTLISLFPDSLRPELMKYFRQHQLSFRKANPTDIQNLLLFIGSHLENLARN